MLLHISLQTGFGLAFDMRGIICKPKTKPKYLLHKASMQARASQKVKLKN